MEYINKEKYFNMDEINSECVKCDEVEEIINNICNFIEKVNINNFDELIKKYEFEIVDFWGGYMGFLKVEYYNKLENIGLFKYF